MQKVEKKIRRFIESEIFPKKKFMQNDRSILKQRKENLRTLWEGTLTKQLSVSICPSPFVSEWKSISGVCIYTTCKVEVCLLRLPGHKHCPSAIVLSQSSISIRVRQNMPQTHRLFSHWQHMDISAETIGEIYTNWPGNWTVRDGNYG